MANALNENLTHKAVIFHQEVLRDGLKNTEQPFLVTGGFGALPFTSGGNVSGEWLSDGEHGAMPGHLIERLATDEEVAAASAKRSES